MLVRGGSPLNGALSGLCGPIDEKIASSMFLLPVPIWDGGSGRAASSPVGRVFPMLPVAVPPPRPFSNSSGRNGRASS